MDEEKAFEDALREDPFDEASHRAYADWLLERDRPEEAEPHLRWTRHRAERAEGWLRAFVARVNDDAGIYGDARNVLTYEDLLQALYEGEPFVFRGVNEPSLVHEEAERMWQEFEALTGRPASEASWRGHWSVPFTCAC